MKRLREAFREPARAVGEVFRNPSLRRVQLAWAGSVTGQYAFSVALSVYAYHHGGAGAVGVLILVRMLPAALVAPFAALAADRGRRERVMLASDLARAAAVGGAAALVAAGGPAAPVYVLAAVVSTVSTIFHPAEAALLPGLARTPEELTAANLCSSSIESVGAFAGPAIGGAILAAASIEAEFVATAAAFVWSALLVARLRPERLEPAAPSPAAAESSAAGELIAGFRTILVEPKLRVVVGLYAAQTMVAGALPVLIVVVALRLLDAGNGGVGYLNSAIGIGGLAGTAVVLALVARRRLAGDFGAGIVLWGAPLVVVGIEPGFGLALAMLGAIGLGNTLVDVSARTLLQRSAPDEVLARVFGVVEGLTVGAMALGAVVVPGLVAWLGPRGALVATGLFLPALAALLWTRLARIDREAEVPERRLALLRAIPIFAPLPAATLEHLARALRPVSVAAGADVVRAGEPGDDLFVVEAGTAEVLLDDGPRPVGPGGFFGEIALLRDVPRTATVRAATPLELWALERNEFVGAVTGHAPSRDAADLVIGQRLGALRAGVVPG